MIVVVCSQICNSVHYVYNYKSEIKLLIQPEYGRV